MSAASEGKVVRAAVRDGIADGCKEHLPAAVGIAVNGGAWCGIASFLHFVLGVDVTHTALGAAGAGVGTGLGVVFRRRRRGESSRLQP